MGESKAGGQTREYLVPRHVTLEGFAAEATRGPGLDIASLTPLTQLSIATHNSIYLVTLVDPERHKVLIQGGRFFVAPCEAYLCGSSFGGSLLRLGWIGFGMRLEVSQNGRRIVTSPVQSIAPLAETAVPGPF